MCLDVITGIGGRAPCGARGLKWIDRKLERRRRRRAPCGARGLK